MEGLIQEEVRAVLDALEAEALIYQMRENSRQEGWDGDMAQKLRNIAKKLHDIYKK